MKRSHRRTLGALLIGLAAAGGLWAPSPGEAATVFSSLIPGSFCFCGAVNGLFAEGFTPEAANYDFTGAAARVLNFDDHAQDFSLALYSSTGAGAPDAALWSATVSAPGATDSNDFANSVVSANYVGPPILLQSGLEYFLAVDTNNIAWLGGEGSLPSYEFSGGSWIPATLIGANDLQFEVYGDPVVPEPSTLALTALGFGLLGVAGWRSRRRRQVFAPKRQPPKCEFRTQLAWGCPDMSKVIPMPTLLSRRMIAEQPATKLRETS
jgi:hypothetical protein